ncbi:MAG: 50S ribosomal protein L23 [Bacteroidales bacterium]|nr:50S ribosomal protein L23 [Bacteroidales bacterium]
MDILIKPVNTEKVTDLEKLNQYVFIVHMKANKIEVKNAIEKVYGVKVLSVNTVRYAGKRRERFTKGGLVRGKTRSFKKAYITLADGDKIDIFNN